jgi:hypothetical protein
VACDHDRSARPNLICRQPFDRAWRVLERCAASRIQRRTVYRPEWGASQPERQLELRATRRLGRRVGGEAKEESSGCACALITSCQTVNLTQSCSVANMSGSYSNTRSRLYILPSTRLLILRFIYSIPLPIQANLGTVLQLTNNIRSRRGRVNRYSIYIAGRHT